MSDGMAWRISDRARRLYERIRERGYSSLMAFAKARPAVPLVVLVRELGLRDDAAGTLLLGLFDEAERGNRVTRLVRDVLARTLAEEFPEGWPAVMDVDNRCKAAQALSRWQAFIPVTYDERAYAITETLRSEPPHPGWRPLGPDDALLRTLLPDEEA
ncbi:MAG: NUDIX hydrolase [Hyalangium sp.]|uniref:NUDIX hydrolase n=1 Tax=Hyalangium sp. TaxID=2028555 RepID=UPI00389A64EF